MVPVPPAGDSLGDPGAARGAGYSGMDGCWVAALLAFPSCGWVCVSVWHVEVLDAVWRSDWDTRPRKLAAASQGLMRITPKFFSCALLSSCAGVKQEADPEGNGACNADPARRVDARAGVQAAAHAAEAANGPDPAAAPD